VKKFEWKRYWSQPLEEGGGLSVVEDEVCVEENELPCDFTMHHAPTVIFKS